MLVNFRISMGWNSRNIEDAWHNTLEFDYDGAIDYDGVQAVFQPIVDAWQAIHLPVVEFLQYSVSTYVQDSEPYNPNSFVTVPLDFRGTRVLSNAQPLADNECYFIRKQPASGRVGKIYLRGVLAETDVEVRSDGKFVLSAASPLRPAGAEWTAFLAELSPFLNSQALTRMVMASTNGEGFPTVRSVNTLVPSGVKDVNTNHKWYNRSAGTLGGN